MFCWCGSAMVDDGPLLSGTAGGVSTARMYRCSTNAEHPKVCAGPPGPPVSPATIAVSTRAPAASFTVSGPVFPQPPGPFTTPLGPVDEPLLWEGDQA